MAMGWIDRADLRMRMGKLERYFLPGSMRSLCTRPDTSELGGRQERGCFQEVRSR